MPIDFLGEMSSGDKRRAPDAARDDRNSAVTGAMRLLPSSRGVPSVSPGERTLLAQAFLEGNRVFWSLAKSPGKGLSGLDEARNFLFRRWVLDTLLALTIQGPSSYNSLSNALGRPAGQSLAPKLDALREANFVSRSVTAPVPLRVEYSLTPAGERLGACVYLMMRWKGLQALETQHPGMALPVAGGPGGRAPLGADDKVRALNRYFAIAVSFAKTREAYCRPREFEDALAMTRRFCGAWVHKWHGRILLALAIGGPMRFADLRSSLGIGDQALSLALAGLLELAAIQPSGTDGGHRYEVAPFGWADLSLSMPLTLLVRDSLAAGAQDPSRRSRGSR